jgi:hypothetical protein
VGAGQQLPGQSQNVSTPWLQSIGNATFFGNLSEAGLFHSPFQDLSGSGVNLVWSTTNAIVLYDPFTNETTNVTQGPGPFGSPVFGGHYVAYTQANPQTGASSLWVFNVTSGNTTLIRKGNQTYTAHSILGDWLLYTDSPRGAKDLIVLNLSSGANYTVSAGVDVEDPILFGGNCVAWRQLSYGEYDIAVTSIPGGRVHFLTHNRAIKMPPATNGSALFFTQTSDPTTTSYPVLFVYDPKTQNLTSRTEGTSINAIQFMDPVDEIVADQRPHIVDVTVNNFSAHVSNSLALNFPADNIPVVLGRFLLFPAHIAGRYFFFAGEASRYATLRAPRAKIIDPADGVIVYQATEAHGTFANAPGWPKPTLFRWRARSTVFADNPNWTTMPVGPTWSASFDPFGDLQMPDGTAAFDFEAQFGTAPPVQETAFFSVRQMITPTTSLPASADLSLMTLIVKDPGIFLFVILVVLFLVMLLLRQRLRRPRFRYEVEYVPPPR